MVVKEKKKKSLTFFVQVQGHSRVGLDIIQSDVTLVIISGWVKNS